MFESEFSKCIFEINHSRLTLRVEVCVIFMPLLFSQTKLGVINTCQIAVKSMSHQTGIIANISSMLGVKVKPGLPVYCAAKHGVIAFTRTMAVSNWEKHSNFLIYIFHML